MNPILIAGIAGIAVLALSSFGGRAKPQKKQQPQNSASGLYNYANKIGQGIASTGKGSEWENLRIKNKDLGTYIKPGGTLFPAVLFGPLGAIPGIISGFSRQAEAERLESTIKAMEAGNWFKVQTPDGKVGLLDVKAGRATAGDLPEMIDKVSRYIDREDNACGGFKNKGRERSCRRYYAAARIVRQYLADALMEAKNEAE